MQVGNWHSRCDNGGCNIHNNGYSGQEQHAREVEVSTAFHREMMVALFRTSVTQTETWKGKQERQCQ